MGSSCPRNSWNVVIYVVNVNIRTEVPHGKREIAKLFTLSKEDVNRYINKSLRDSCRLVRDYARKHHRYENRPARQEREGHIGLTRAIHFRVIDKIKHGEVYIDEKEAPYGKYQDGGTKSPIVPKRSKYLRFFSDRYGKWFTKMKVNGIPKDDFIHRAYKNTQADIRTIFRDYLRRLLRGKL